MLLVTGAVGGAIAAPPCLKSTAAGAGALPGNAVFQMLSELPYGVAGEAQPTDPGIDLSGGSVVCGGEVGGCRRLPQFKQKLSPGLVSALQKGHVLDVDVRLALPESFD